jgi:hypothetical protein
VAVSNQYHEAKSVGAWLTHGWHVGVAYIVGFFVMLALWGWPGEKRFRSVDVLPPVAAMISWDCADGAPPSVCFVDIKAA